MVANSTPRHKSTSQWELALRLAEDSLEIFQRPVKSIENVEKNGKEVLELLGQRHVLLLVLIRIFKHSHQDSSVCTMPRFSKFTGPDDDDAIFDSEKLSKIALDLVKHWHGQKLQVGNLPATYGARDLTVIQQRPHKNPLYLYP